MKDGTGAGEQAVLRPDVYEDYVRCYLQERAEVGPCRDPRLLKKAAQYLLNEAEATGTFTVFPFYQAVTEGFGAQGAAFRKHLSAFIRAAELLETLCVNLFVQPWKKEIKTLKTFTGPFVYCLGPVFSNSTIQSVLASIGYVPHPDPKQCEYRLSEDANPDRAMLIGFELLLARVECYHFLELQEDQLGPQRWLEVLQRRVQPIKVPECRENQTAIAQTEDEEEKKTNELDKKEVLYFDTRLVVDPPSKSQHYHLCSVDQSIMEMQRTYPDLAIRGRPLLPDKPHKAHSSTSNSKVVCTTDLPKRDCLKNPKAAAAATTLSRNDDSKTKETYDNIRSSRHCEDSNSGDSVSCSFNSSDRSGAEDGLSGPQAISLHLTLRAGSKEQKPGEPQPTEEPLARAQQNTEPRNESQLESEFSTQSSVDEEQELRELAERMGQLCVEENKHEATGKEGDDTNKDRRKKARKSSAERERKKKNLRKQVLEKGPTPGHGDGASTRPPQCDPAGVSEQQPSLRQPSLLTDCQECQDCREYQDCRECQDCREYQDCRECQDCQTDGSSQQEAEAAGCEDAGPAEDEHSFVIVGQCRC